MIENNQDQQEKNSPIVEPASNNQKGITPNPEQSGESIKEKIMPPDSIITETEKKLNGNENGIITQSPDHKPDSNPGREGKSL